MAGWRGGKQAPQSRKGNCARVCASRLFAGTALISPVQTSLARISSELFAVSCASRFSVAGSDRRVVDFYCFPESHISLVGARARCTHASQSQKAETCFCTLYLSLVPRMHSRFQRTHLSGLFNFMRRFVLRALCRRPSWKRLGDDAITFHDRDDYKNVECREQRDSRAHCPFKGRKNRNSTKMKKHARTTLLWTRLQCILIFSSIIYYWSSAIKKFCSYISTLVRQPTCEVTLKNVNAVHNFALGEIYKGYTKSGYFLRSPTA